MHTIHKSILAVFAITLLNSASHATVFYEDDFESPSIKYVGEKNKHPGGGFISYLGGEIVAGVNPGNGTQDFTKFTNVLLDSSTEAQGAVPNSKNALKTQYKAGYAPGSSSPGFGYAGDFNLNTTMVAFPETDTVYVRWYQKWGANWSWPADQQKLIKLKGYNQSQNFKISFGKSYINLTKKSPPPNGAMNETYVFADLATSGEGAASAWRQTDSDSKTTNFPLAINRWYCIEVMVKSNTLLKNDAEFSYWIDGDLKFNLINSFNRDIAGGISHIELQHVIQDVWDKVRTKDTPTWMDNIAVADQRLGCDGASSPPNVPQSPRLVK